MRAASLWILALAAMWSAPAAWADYSLSEQGSAKTAPPDVPKDDHRGPTGDEAGSSPLTDEFYKDGETPMGVPDSDRRGPMTPEQIHPLLPPNGDEMDRAGGHRDLNEHSFVV